MEKNICEAKLNGWIANNKVHETLKKIKNADPSAFEGMTIENGICLCLVLVRKPIFKRKANRPFFAFVKQVGDAVAMVDVQSGDVAIVSKEAISGRAEVKGRFKIKGVTYKLKDTVNGFKRYEVSSCTEKQKNKRVKVQKSQALAESEAVVAAAAAATATIDEPEEEPENGFLEVSALALLGKTGFEEECDN